MAIRTLQPENRTKKDIGTLGTVVGGVAGAVMGGGPIGAAKGAVAGKGIGDTVGGVVAPDQAPIREMGQRGPMDTSMARRQSALETGGSVLGVAEGVQGFGNRVNPPAAETGPGQAPAMQRRAESPTNTLMNAESALGSLSEDEQRRYGPTLRQARMLDRERRRGYED